MHIKFTKKLNVELIHKIHVIHLNLFWVSHIVCTSTKIKIHKGKCTYT